MVASRSHRHQADSDDQPFVDADLPTEAESRAWLAANDPEGYGKWLSTQNVTPLYPQPVIHFDLTILMKIYSERSAPPIFEAGEEVTIRNGRKGMVHLLMSNGLYRILYTGSSLSFATPEYYTPQALWALNPAKKKAA